MACPVLCTPAAGPLQPLHASSKITTRCPGCWCWAVPTPRPRHHTPCNARVWDAMAVTNQRQIPLLWIQWLWHALTGDHCILPVASTAVVSNLIFVRPGLRFTLLVQEDQQMPYEYTHKYMHTNPALPLSTAYGFYYRSFLCGEPHPRATRLKQLRRRVMMLHKQMGAQLSSHPAVAAPPALRLSVLVLPRPSVMDHKACRLRPEGS